MSSLDPNRHAEAAELKIDVRLPTGKANERSTRELGEFGRKALHELMSHAGMAGQYMLQLMKPIKAGSEAGIKLKGVVPNATPPYIVIDIQAESGSKWKSYLQLPVDSEPVEIKSLLEELIARERRAARQLRRDSQPEEPVKETKRDDTNVVPFRAESMQPNVTETAALEIVNDPEWVAYILGEVASRVVANGKASDPYIELSEIIQICATELGDNQPDGIASVVVRKLIDDKYLGSKPDSSKIYLSEKSAKLLEQNNRQDTGTTLPVKAEQTTPVPAPEPEKPKSVFDKALRPAELKQLVLEAKGRLYARQHAAKEKPKLETNLAMERARLKRHDDDRLKILASIAELEKKIGAFDVTLTSGNLKEDEELVNMFRC